MLCNISNFSDIIKVEYFTPDSVSFTRPFIIFEPTASVADKSAVQSPSADRSAYCTILQHPAHIAMIDDMSGELSVEESVATAGHKFKCTLTYNMEWINTSASQAEFKAQLSDLQYGFYHVRVTYLGGDQHFIRCDKDGWMFTYRENKGTLSVSVVIDNMCGAQRVTM